MIDPKELRIGNLIYYSVEHEWESESDTFEKKNELAEVTAIGEHIYFNVRDGRYITSSSNPDLSPIPLTEEWLLKFGFTFKRTDKSNTYTLGSFRASYVTEGRFKNKRYLTYGNALTFEDFWNCKYVHQLQNLHYSLCGEELEITVIQNTAE